MNKKIILTLMSFFCATLLVSAQVAEEPHTAGSVQVVKESNGTSTTTEQTTKSAKPTQTQATLQIRYGTISYNSILKQMPEYEVAKVKMGILRQEYEKEALYNENTFKRMFAEFLQGQKDFPKNIMLKRQRDLQEEMEKGLAYRHEADSLLQQTELDMMKPLREMLDKAIFLVGSQRGYECIFNIDTHSAPFLHPMITEDATPFVLEKLKALRHR